MIAKAIRSSLLCRMIRIRLRSFGMGSFRLIYLVLGEWRYGMMCRCHWRKLWFQCLAAASKSVFENTRASGYLDVYGERLCFADYGGLNLLWLTLFDWLNHAKKIGPIESHEVMFQSICQPLTVITVQYSLLLSL
jgi:hypothetical protein